MTLQDGATLVIVHALAAAYAVTVLTWLVAGGGDPGQPRPERVGLSLVLGVLLLATANYFLSILVGSAAAAVAVLAGPLANAAIVASSRRWRRAVVEAVKGTGVPVATAVAIATIFSVSIAYNLFAWNPLATTGVLHADLSVHIGIATQLAFQGSPGFLPLSPIAFPGPLPFIAVAADSLVAATFRYLPFVVHGFHFPQVLFCWVAVLLSAVVLVADPRPWQALVVLVISILVVPAIAYFPGPVTDLIAIWFHANPNSALARPISLALAFHLYRAFLRRTPPSLAVLAFVPPASVFFKVNEAPTFGFLQLVGFAWWLWLGGPRATWKPAAWAAAAWLPAIVAMTRLAAWPVPIRIAPSMDHLWHYASVAIPAVGRAPSVSRLVLVFALSLCLTYGVGAVSLALRREPMDRRPEALGREVTVPVMTLALGMIYLLICWWAVMPDSGENGEPMHVNFDLVLALMTPPIALAVCRACGRSERGRPVGGIRFAAALVCGIGLLMAWGGFAWRMKDSRSYRGGLPPALENRIRLALSSRIPEGHCYGYGRRYVLFVNGGFDPDVVIAATGCAVLNGRRFRGIFGVNDPKALMDLPDIPVASGAPFRVLEVQTCTAPPAAPRRFAVGVVGHGLTFSWGRTAGARSYIVEAGSAAGLSDGARLTVASESTSAVVPVVRPGTYFVRVRADNLCGLGAASEERAIQVR